MIKLIASDLDGTLLNDEKKIPAEFFSLMPLLKGKGVRFVAASGRSRFTLRENFSAVADDIDYICDNGAVVYAGGEKVHEIPLPDDVVAGIIDESEHMEDVCLLLCAENGTYHLPVDYSRFACHINPYYINQIVVDDLRKVPERVFKIALCDLHGPAAYAYPHLKERFGDRADMQISGHVWMDLMSTGVNKGVGLKILQGYYGVTEEETMAFGDYYNDVELLAGARYSFVMENANPDMRQYGRYLCAANTENGVVRTIRRMLTL